MPKPKEVIKPDPPAQDPLPGVGKVKQRIQNDQGHIEELNQEAEKAREMRIKMCEQFLESALSAAKLPAPVTKRLRDQFAGRLFEADELTAAVEDSRTMVSELTGGSVVQRRSWRVSS